jgi:hypothetical protein
VPRGGVGVARRYVVAGDLSHHRAEAVEDVNVRIENLAVDREQVVPGI